MTEIEIKVQIEKSQDLLAFLSQEAKLVKEELQIDEYFSPRESSFLDAEPVKEWLRLRNENNVSSINYKSWYYDADGKSSHCDEYETTIGSLAELRSILRALKFEPIITVHKQRRSYLYKEYEVSLDEVKDLGSFVEIELKSEKEQDPHDVTEGMMTFLQRFSVGVVSRDFKGYPKLLLEKRKLLS